MRKAVILEKVIPHLQPIINIQNFELFISYYVVLKLVGSSSNYLVRDIYFESSGLCKLLSKKFKTLLTNYAPDELR